MPTISLPKGGGAIRGMGEKFGSNPVTGTGSMSVPIATSPGRSGFAPQLSLSYDSGAGNGPFGFGWSLSLPSISRKTDKGLPRYDDAEESDVFILSGAEDLVPVLKNVGGGWQRHVEDATLNGLAYSVQRYRPRIEGLFARIERWTSTSNAQDVFWRSISRDNVTTWYGKSAESRIADPADRSRVFSWLISESHDDKGNAILYRYKAEDSAGVDTASLTHERNRTPAGRSAGRHLKRILFGNRTPRVPDEDLAARQDWLFEAVFDYGEHYTENAQGQLQSVWLDDQHRAWPVREDPFSTCRAGFDVRTYRLCRRVLMFHHFPEELHVADCLVRSTEFVYSERPMASFLTQVVQSGYVRSADGSYLKKSLPALDCEYSLPEVSDKVQEVDSESLKNLPTGANGPRYRWLDLDGEGLQCVLAEQEDGWYYKRNVSPSSLPMAQDASVSPARFDPITEVVTLPSFAETGAERYEFVDLAGDGQLDCVVFARPVSGFFERTLSADWEVFKPVSSIPNVDWNEPNLRFIDLTGDGRADILITEDAALVWHPSIGEDGFDIGVRIPRPRDDDEGPTVVFADSTQAIFVADMSGDGLSDIVRVRNGEVCYWPNLGYGQFGAKVTMDRSPWFDAPDVFDQRRIRLADIDGSGVADIIYVGRDGVRLYFNESGNGWSEPKTIDSLPQVDDVGSIQAVDLLSNGTACLVWTSPLPGNAGRSMRYIDLMGGQKPHLLVRTANNFGAETTIQYAPSTKFYVDDKLAGRPWVTRLPFPVHVVTKIETRDRVSRNRFVTRFAYHHGYFDGEEREFRGFGMVEQWDTEEFGVLNAGQELAPAANIDASSHVPPVLTRTWYHTGVFVDGRRVSNYFAGLLDGNDAGEYYREPGLDDATASRLLLEDTVLPPGLTADEEREACRALKGAMLRQEVYALDGSDKAPHPYVVTEQNFTLRILQPQNENRHAVFLSHPRESISYHYERNPADPRVEHGLTLDVDDFGNVVKSAAVVYARRHADAALEPRDQAKQSELCVSYVENAVTNAVDSLDTYRAPLLCESRSYELTGLQPGTENARVRVDDLLAAGPASTAITYEQTATPGMLQKRLIEHTRTLYRADNLEGALALGELESLAIPFESYALAFTPGLLSTVYGTKVTNSMLADDGGYVEDAGQGTWWIPSGRVFLSPGATDDAPTELATARHHFFLPRRYEDPFGNVTQVAYDAYDLLMQETRDALANTVTVGERDASGNLVAPGNDYRVLQPRFVTDANSNRAAAAFDALGMVVGTAVMGKRGETPPRGDLLDGFDADLPDHVVAAHLSDPLDDPHSILGRATTRLMYDLFAYLRTRNDDQPMPSVVYALTRETHDADLGPGEQTRVQHALSYSDGFGREIQKKSLVDGRWVTSGWTIFNNKSAPVEQFEPFFSQTHAFEFGAASGVSSIVFYDPPGRAVATLHPNHSWEKVVFDPWRQERWDVNDTILIADPKADPDVGDFFHRLREDKYLPGWHAQRQGTGVLAEEADAAAKTAIHAATPAVTHADSLGRTFVSVTHNTFERNGAVVDEKHATRVELDIEGNQREVIDANDRVVMRYAYDMLGSGIYQASMEAGERWMLANVAGTPIYAWDSRDHRFRTRCDALRRPTHTFLASGSSPERLVAQTVYDGSEDRNLRGKVVQAFDQAGVVTTDDYDFKGNPLRGGRQLAEDYKAVLDWSANPTLGQPIFASRTTYDALNRPASINAPDGSIYRPTFNEAGLLVSIAVNLRGAQTASSFVTNIDYNAKGQRERVEYGNGVKTQYEYDPLTFRLRNLKTTRTGDQARLQDLTYTYDPAGNITHISDAAQQTLYFANQVVTPDNDYVYDAVYRLIEAQGREHIGQASQPQTTWDDEFRTHLPAPGDGQAMRRYTEQYRYDAVGNFLEFIHQAAQGNWTRAYVYDKPSPIEPAKHSNRLGSTTVGGNGPELYTYDVHGNTTSMPHLSSMQWDFRDQLQATSRQVVTDGTPETTYYVYDASGQRVRKVTERQNGTRANERIYLGAFEVYREFDGAGADVTLERETLHVMDNAQRVALVESRIHGTETGVPPQLTRYQYGNHLGSGTMEVDDAGSVISYEEYYPYGSTSHQSVRTATETPKRYRYTASERDEETGLTRHGVRYYALWLGRWISCDLAGLRASGPTNNLYCAVALNPIKFIDIDGLSPEKPPVPGPVKRFLIKVVIVIGTILGGGREGPAKVPRLPPPPLPDEKTIKRDEELEKERERNAERKKKSGGAGGGGGTSPPPEEPPGTSDPHGTSRRTAYPDVERSAVKEGAAKLEAEAANVEGGLGGKGQRGSAALPLMALVAAVGLIAGSKKAREFARDVAAGVAIQSAFDAAFGPMLGLGITLFVLPMSSDSAQVSQRQAYDKVINDRIKKLFPGEYSNEYCLRGLGWPCIEIETAGSFGPHYEEARRAVELALPIEQAVKQSLELINQTAKKSIDAHNKKVLQRYRDQFPPGAGTGSYATPPDYIYR